MAKNSIGSVMPSASADFSLHDIIKDRKAEKKLKAEEKRQMDLQRIKDMKSSTGIDPLERFPKEVWQMIFNELTPPDRGNASLVHPLFRDLLENTRIQEILFPQVIQLPQFQRSSYAPYYGSMELSDFARLRSVSKTMRNAVDCWIENAIRKNSEVDGNLELPLVSLSYDTIEGQNNLRRILSSFGEEGELRRRRFFPRAVSIAFPIEAFYDIRYPDADGRGRGQRARGNSRQFKDDISSLLEKIGPQILLFVFYLPRFFPSGDRELTSALTETYNLLRQWASVMPNLRILQLEGYDPEQEKPSINFQGPSLPFPVLTSLEKVTFKYNAGFEQNVSSQLCHFILSTNPHVKVLKFEGVDDSKIQRLPNDLIRSLPLISFSVVNEKRSNRQSTKLTYQSILPIINFNWKLKTIKLHLYDPSVSINNLFGLLENFPTLECVSIGCLSGVRIGYDDKIEYLRLPNLTEFEVKLYNPDICYQSNMDFLFSLQFLLHCGKLKTLDWSIRWFDDCKLRNHLKRLQNRDPGKTLDFRGGLRALTESNIWNVFPDLEIVKVEGWKNGNRNFPQCYGNAPCEHEYRREDVIGRISVNNFLKSHKCCKGDNQLHNCVMLYG